jgi:DNA polymerase
VPDRLYNDFETFSRLDLKKVGTDRYSRDKSTKPLMLAYALNSSAVEQWVPAEGEPMPKRLKEMLLDPEVIKQSWNWAFEWHIFANCLGIIIPPEQARCSMALASTLSLPMSLGAAGQVLRLPQDLKKDATGKKLIKLFCGPLKPTKKFPATRANFITHPDEWEEFKFYNRQDIEAERGIYQRIKRWEMPDHEWGLWCLDHRINQRGIPINLDTVSAACEAVTEVRAERLEQMVEETGLDNPKSNPQLLEWVRQRGYPYYDLKAGHVRQHIEALNERMQLECNNPDPDDVKLERVLRLRQDISKTSLDKFFALERATADDGRLRNALQFAGAGRTWRWSGRIFQPQNLARPTEEFEKPDKLAQVVEDLKVMYWRDFEEKYPNVVDALSACVRPVVEADPGYVFVDADLNAIENRVLGWIADDREILKVFKKDMDPYLAFAVFLFKLPYSELLKELDAGDKFKRKMAKPGVLGCGYMLSAGQQFEDTRTGEIQATGLLGYALNMGIKLTPELSKLSVDTWRSTYRDAVDFWYQIERAAMRCIRTGKRVECGPVDFDISGPMMRMILPSGRALHYVRPKIEVKMMPWGKKKEVITYEGLDDQNRWVRLDTHPGKLTENADQAISRDVLAHGMQLCEKEGLRIRLHIHDQTVAMVKENRGDEALALMLECLSETPPWAKGLPLKAAGTVTRYLMKD